MGFLSWCQHLSIQGDLSLAALSYRSHPSGWQRGAQHGFRREHVPCLVLPATKCHGQLVTTSSTILTRGSKGAQVCSSYMSLKQCVMRITALLKMFAMGREEGISHPAFVRTQRTLKERILCHHFIPQAWWKAEISD